MMFQMPKLIEVGHEPGRQRYRIWRVELPIAVSSLPAPHVISDSMPPTEQVDGKFYTSKSAFRATGRKLGLTEVGNEQAKPMVRGRDRPGARKARRETISKAIAEYKQGRRPKPV